jgi:hypothetical protein
MQIERTLSSLQVGPRELRELQDQVLHGSSRWSFSRQ